VYKWFIGSVILSAFLLNALFTSSSVGASSAYDSVIDTTDTLTIGATDVTLDWVSYANEYCPLGAIPDTSAIWDDISEFDYDSGYRWTITQVGTDSNGGYMRIVYSDTDRQRQPKSTRTYAKYNEISNLS